MDGAFDTLQYAKRLREQGVPEKQAEAIVEIIADAREVDLRSAATKADLRELELKLTNKIDGLELTLNNKMKDLQIRIGGMIVALGGILIAIRYFG